MYNFVRFFMNGCAKCRLTVDSLGTNSSMFANCSSFGDVREVQSSVLGFKVMFREVRSSVVMFGELYEHLGS